MLPFGVFIVLHEMKTEQVKLSRIHANGANPRLIKDGKFVKLVNSVLVFPRMLEIRPIVVDSAYVVLGGNMRYRALLSIAELRTGELPSRLNGIREYGRMPRKERDVLLKYWMCWLDNPTAPVIRALALTDAEKQAFIIKDNAGFGEWDWDMLSNEWDSMDLNDWGLDVWREAVPEADAIKSPADVVAAESIEGGDAGGEEGVVEAGDDNPFDEKLHDCIYDSDNAYDIPNLLFSHQPQGGLLLPFAGWGSDSRAKKDIKTYHFYVEDYRFEAVWKDPAAVLKSGCVVAVEPNFSLYDTTPVAFGLQQIYKKRWIARYFQEYGVKVYADLNVSRKFYEYNRMGIPAGYDAFATRGYADRMEYLKAEIQIAREISGKDNPNMIVYGGGERVKEQCMKSNVIYVEQFMTNKKK